MQSKSIAILGNAALDIIFTGLPDTLVARHSNVCDTIQLLPGGSGLNVACAARVFVEKVTLFTRIADDLVARPILEECKNRGIDIVNLVVDDESKFQTPRIAVHLDKSKERTFIAGDNGGLDLDAEHITAERIELIATHDLVVFAGLTPRSGFAFAEMDSIFRQIRERNPHCIFVGDVIAMAGLGGIEWRRALDSHLRNYHWFLPSEEELVQLTDDMEMEEELQLTSDDSCGPIPIYVKRAKWQMSLYENLQVVGVKLSGDGAIVCRRSESGFAITRHDIAYRRTIVDKTGAGDSWVGAFIAGALISERADGLHSFDAAARHGNAAASHCIMYLGATAWCDNVTRAKLSATIDSIRSTPLDP